MSKILAVGTAVPPHVVSQSEAKAFAYELFGGSFPQMERLLPIFEHTDIKQRYLSCPTEWYSKEHSFPKRNQLYVDIACSLCEMAIQQCLDQTGTSVDEIDHLIFVSTSGIATPSIDAHLINRFQFSPHIKRTPIWGLGCAGGVAGLARAYEYTKGFPSARVLMVAVELCSLTFRPQDHSKSNFVATSLFADGAAAVLVVGDAVASSGNAPSMVESRSTIWSDSLDVMGWKIVDDGLQVVFSRDIPTIVRQQVRPIVDQFLAEQHLQIDQISYMVSHPGGKKVLEAYAHALELPEDRFRYAHRVLQSYGNMSSVTVLFVLAEVLLETIHCAYGLMTSLGPGFSSELLLLKWD